MGELREWIKYWRKTISKCAKIHKDSHAHKVGYTELTAYLSKVEGSIGLHVVEKKIPSSWINNLIDKACHK